MKGGQVHLKNSVGKVNSFVVLKIFHYFFFIFILIIDFFFICCRVLQAHLKQERNQKIRLVALQVKIGTLTALMTLILLLNTKRLRLLKV